MNGSDVVVGWIKNGVANFTDRFIYNREVRIDKHQDWNLLKFSQKNGFTIFKFQRPIKLCNPEDLTIDVKKKIKLKIKILNFESNLFLLFID